MVTEHAAGVCAVAVAEAESLGDFFGVVNVGHISCPEGGDCNLMTTLEAKRAVEREGAAEVAEVGEEGG